MTRVLASPSYLNLILGPIPQPPASLVTLTLHRASSAHNLWSGNIGCFAPDYRDARLHYAAPPIATQITPVPLGTGWMTGSVYGLWVLIYR